MDETWTTEDVCVQAHCEFDVNANPIIKNQAENCNVVCKAVSEFDSLINLKPRDP